MAHSLFALTMFLLSNFWTPMSHAQGVTEGDKSDLQEKYEKGIFKKIRLRHFSEFTSSAMETRTIAVPDPEGLPGDPTNAYSYTWIDYELSPGLSIVYWQNTQFNYGPEATVNGTSFNFFDPRFALRFFAGDEDAGQSSMIDLYVEPGLRTESIEAHRLMNLGMRTSFSYDIPRTRFSIGIITETAIGLFSGESESVDVGGYAAPWGAYNFTKTFSTQTWLSIPYQHQRGNQLTAWTWGSQGLPYIQNGLGINVSDTVWLSMMINNYLGAPILARNTWASLWVSLNLL